MSANEASRIHHEMTGKWYKITEEAVNDSVQYEEIDDSFTRRRLQNFNVGPILVTPGPYHPIPDLQNPHGQQIVPQDAVGEQKAHLQGKLIEAVQASADSDRAMSLHAEESREGTQGTQINVLHLRQRVQELHGLCERQMGILTKAQKQIDDLKSSIEQARSQVQMTPTQDFARAQHFIAMHENELHSHNTNFQALCAHAQETQRQLQTAKLRLKALEMSLAQQRQEYAQQAQLAQLQQQQQRRQTFLMAQPQDAHQSSFSMVQQASQFSVGSGNTSFSVAHSPSIPAALAPHTPSFSMAQAPHAPAAPVAQTSFTPAEKYAGHQAAAGIPAQYAARPQEEVRRMPTGSGAGPAIQRNPSGSSGAGYPMQRNMSGSSTAHTGMHTTPTSARQSPAMFMSSRNNSIHTTPVSDQISPAMRMSQDHKPAMPTTHTNTHMALRNVTGGPATTSNAAPSIALAAHQAFMQQYFNEQQEHLALRPRPQPVPQAQSRPAPQAQAQPVPTQQPAPQLTSAFPELPELSHFDPPTPAPSYGVNVNINVGEEGLSWLNETKDAPPPLPDLETDNSYVDINDFVDVSEEFLNWDLIDFGP